MPLSEEQRKAIRDIANSNPNPFAGGTTETPPTGNPNIAMDNPASDIWGGIKGAVGKGVDAVKKYGVPGIPPQAIQALSGSNTPATSTEAPQEPQKPIGPPLTAPPGNKVPGAVAVPGAGMSPYQEEYNANMAEANKQEESMNRQQTTVKHVQNLQQMGADEAEKLYKDANYQKLVGDQEVTKAEREAQYHTIQRDNAIAIQAEEQRAKHVDPQKWFKDRGVAGSILAAVAMGAGAFGAAMPHTNSKQNFAMDIIEKSIDRDVNAQQDDIENGWKSLNFNANKAERDYQHENYATNQLKERKLLDYNHALAIIAQKRQMTTDKVAIANLDNMSEGIEQKRSDLHIQMNAQKRDYKVRDAAAAAAQAAKNSFSEREISEEANKILHDSKLQPPEGVERNTDWARGLARQNMIGRTPGQPSIATSTGGTLSSANAAKVAEGEALAGDIDKMTKLVNGPINAETAGQYETLHAQAVARISKNATGRYNEQETQRLLNSLPPPNALHAAIRNKLPYLGIKDTASLRQAAESLRSGNRALRKGGAGAQETELPTTPEGD